MKVLKFGGTSVGNVQRIDKPRKHLAAYPFHRLHVSDKLFWNLFHNFQRNINSMPLGILQNFLQRFPQVRLNRCGTVLSRTLRHGLI